MSHEPSLTKEIPMLGHWTVTRTAAATFHTFTAPDEGWNATSHIVELPSKLLVVDAQYTLPLAAEVVRHVGGLSKPLDRLYVTHYHPDHLLGARAFDAPLLTLESVAEKVAAAGNRVAREEHEKVGNDSVPTTARMPDRLIPEGEEVVDGVLLQHRRLRGAETEDALVVAIPAASVVIVQDLVYNQAHPFLGERDFAGWRSALLDYKRLPYQVVLPGHGKPGGPELYDETLRYLDVAEEILHTAGGSAEFADRMRKAFPGYGGTKILDHELRFLFRNENAPR